MKKAVRTADDVRKAADMLGLGERASVDEIKHAYRSMLKQWHPDTSSASPEECNEMTIRIQRSYELLLSYCGTYRFPFDDASAEDPAAFWMRRFGGDHAWGRNDI